MMRDCLFKFSLLFQANTPPTRTPYLSHAHTPYMSQMPSRSHSLHTIAYSHSQVYRHYLYMIQMPSRSHSLHTKVCSHSQVYYPLHEPGASGSHSLHTIAYSHSQVYYPLHEPGASGSHFLHTIAYTVKTRRS
jgi:hypothetical protein